MNKKNKKSIIYSLGVLAVLTLGIMAIPTKASADIAGFVTPYGSTSFNNNIQGNNQYNTYTYQAPSNPAPITYITSTTSNSQNASQTKNSTSTSNKSTSTTSTTNSGDLAANAIFGSGGFMPSGLIQWILIAIFILLIVILVRKITGAEDKYHSEPMKHA